MRYRVENYLVESTMVDSYIEIKIITEIKDSAEQIVEELNE